MRATLAALLMLLAGNVFAQLPGGSGGGLLGDSGSAEFLPVEQAYQLDVEVVNDRTLRLYWQIADSYYLYQHRFAFELTGNGLPVAVTPEFPPALARTDEYFGEVQVYYHGADIVLNTPGGVRNAVLKVTSQGCADAGLCYPPRQQYFDIDFASGAVAPAEKPGAPATTAAEGKAGGNGGASLWHMLLLAFMGGAILNLMPCVFPVLSLKVLSFAKSTDHDRHLQSWVYTAGVISSFVLVAAILIGLQQAGQAVGWGFQLQSPGFVIALAYLFVAMGLSLSGVVELGSSLMNTGSGLASRQGLSGSFFTGVLAVVVASPCTAPFMGTALGFAVSQPPQVGLLVFAALGAGMAAPLLLFSYSGAARRLMPQPGPWMETLKQFLAFPLYATAIWLLWVAGRQTGVNTLAAALAGALMIALGLWVWNHRAWRRGVALACLAAAVALGSVRGLDAPVGNAAESAGGALAWSDEKVASLRSAGNPVFVDVTADWCITCKANESAVLFTRDITRAFEEHGVVYMVADWTNQDARIAQLLRRHERNGIPLYLMYPADSSLEPIILPQILTKSIVREAIEAVSGKNANVAVNF
jgi:thiol:disulfide interchange protein DsbD